MGLKRTIRRAVNRLGYDMIRMNQSPARTLLGLARWDIAAVIDVGANRGQFAQMISRFFPSAQLHCFEPLEGPYRELSSWAQTQNGRVTCYQLALGDQEQDAAMHVHQDHSESSSLLHATETCHRLYPQTQKEHITKISVSTLDITLAHLLGSFPREILLKLDVQGFEDRVLRGGQHVLSRCRAVLLEAGLDQLYEGQADFRELVQLLHDAGFRYAGNLHQAYREDGRVVYIDALFVTA